MDIVKPKLSVDEQIEHLKSKGVLFNIMDEEEAKDYLRDIITIRNENNIYCGDIINKYDQDYPIWAFVEIIPFGRVISFYGFCADRFQDKKMKNTYYQLLTCKEIRNAAAHSNCVLNDLKSGTAKHDTSNEVTKELAKINAISKGFRKVKMSNARIQQIVTLLYVHKNLVVSEGIRKNECVVLTKVIDRMFQNEDYYKENDVIKGTFNFLKLVVDNWFSMA